NGKAYSCYACGSIMGYYQDDMSDAMLRGNPQSFNCYSTCPDANATLINDVQIEGGELCYMLNEAGGSPVPVFYQTLGRDDHPLLLHHLEVIRVGDEFVNKMDYALRTPQDVIDFAEMVNTGLPEICGLVTSDLDFNGLTVTPIGTADNPFTGIFDGGGHTFSGLTIATNKNYTGLFGIVGGGAVIRNFVLDETCSISGSAYVGIIGGSNGSGTVTMERLGNEGSVTAANQNAGGIFGCNMGGAATPIFRNCYVTGHVKGGRESGQITGYAARGEAYNCYASGIIEGVYYADMSDAMLRGNPRSTNCYSTCPDRNATLIDDVQIEGGELCYMLNEGNDPLQPAWFQTLGQDGHPVLDASHAEVLLSPDGSYVNSDSTTPVAPLWAEARETWSLAGIPVKKPLRGIHIVRTADGTTRKVLAR
ncbi:MAG: hypothetical protein J5733_04875, partial [Bacteroidaceae bacterium]|nr:hypothetical protein [Bacteroidaceae bacterium]